MSKFQSSVTKQDDGWHIRIAGVIDEDNQLLQLADQVGGKPAWLELGDVERINSCGVRDWVRWLGQLEQRLGPVTLRECSPAIVAQVNLVHNFTGASAIESFYAPYFCARCDQEKVLLVNTADVRPGTKEPPTCRCDECDQIMEFDDLPDSYFAFLADVRKLKGAVAAVAPEPSVRTRTRRAATMPPLVSALGTPTAHAANTITQGAGLPPLPLAAHQPTHKTPLPASWLAWLSRWPREAMWAVAGIALVVLVVLLYALLS